MNKYCQLNNYHKCFILILICIIVLIGAFLTWFYVFKENTSTDHKEFEQTDKVPDGALIWSSGCRIPDIDPFDPLIISKYFYVRPKHYCSKEPTLTFIEDRDDGNALLKINKTAVKMFKNNSENVSCCYSNITRSPDPKLANTDVVLSPCKVIDNQAYLLPTEEFITVQCQITNTQKHKNRTKLEAHTNIQKTDKIKNRLNAHKSASKKRWNILVIGTDTLSRINLARSMPKTHNYLKERMWLDFQAYNKVNDNTYPNLMAFLTGRNYSRSLEMCDGEGSHSPENCNFVWKDYHNAGYVTAYAEDFKMIDTFKEPRHKGFRAIPTDHFIRPHLLANERTEQILDLLYACTGQLLSGEVIFKYTLQFVKKYINDPFFGFFWTNSFSHQALTQPVNMDNKMTEFLATLEQIGVFENTFVWFLGDHGVRFEKMRHLLTGYYEDRLPALFVSVPPKFKEEYGELYSSLVLNTKRLTNPYDLYLTFQKILELSGERNSSVSSDACPKCHSLFTPMDFNRTCSDCEISSQWCACNPLKSIPVNNQIAKRAIAYILDDYLEKQFDEVNTDKNCRICKRMKLDKILFVYYKDKLPNHNTSASFTDYVIVFSVVDKIDVKFEMTVRHFSKTDEIILIDDLDRITSYEIVLNRIHCMDSSKLRVYCLCDFDCVPGVTNYTNPERNYSHLSEHFSFS